MQSVPEGLRALVSSLFPGAAIEKVAVLGPDVAEGDTEKVEGYGRPIRVTVHEPAGWRREIVFRTATPNDFGHDRRADRAEGLLLANDLFAQIPDHVQALDVGAIAADGRLVSLRGTGEFYLVTEWAQGALYFIDGTVSISRPTASARYWRSARTRTSYDSPFSS